MKFIQIGVNRHINHTIEICVFLFWGALWFDVFKDRATLYIASPKDSRRWKLRFNLSAEKPRISVGGSKVGGWNILTLKK